MKPGYIFIAAIFMFGTILNDVSGQQKASSPNPFGAAPAIMYAEVYGEHGIRFFIHSPVWKYALRTDGSVGTPGSKTTAWTTPIKNVESSTASGSPISEAALRAKLSGKTLVVLSLSDSPVPTEFLEIFKRDAVVLTIKDSKEVRSLLKVFGAEFEPGTDDTSVSKR